MANEYLKAEQRISRIETRLTRLLVAMGIDPHEEPANMGANRAYCISVDPLYPKDMPYIRLTHSSVTLTKLWQFAVDNDLMDADGNVSIRLGDQEIATLHIK